MHQTWHELVHSRIVLFIKCLFFVCFFFLSWAGEGLRETGGFVARGGVVVVVFVVSVVVDAIVGRGRFVWGGAGAREGGTGGG